MRVANRSRWRAFGKAHVQQWDDDDDFVLQYMGNLQIMQRMALWNHFIYFGCWAATISTALTTLLAVPRLLQALGLDQIYPGLIFFSKPYGKHGEPYRGYVLTLIGSLLFLFLCGKKLNISVFQILTFISVIQISVVKWLLFCKMWAATYHYYCICLCILM